MPPSKSTNPFLQTQDGQRGPLLSDLGVMLDLGSAWATILELLEPGAMRAPMMLYEGVTVEAKRRDFPTVNELIDFLRERHEAERRTFFYSLTLGANIITLAYGDFK